MIGELPRSLQVGDHTYEIRTDFRDVLKIISAFNDPDLEDTEKVYICLVILFPDYEDIPDDDLEAAYTAAVKFIDYGSEGKESDRPSKKLMDWEQDEKLMIPAINRVAGMEVRAAEYIHWWTFLGYYMEITDGVYAQVLSIRSKKAKHKKLEKWEREFWNANKDICEIKPRLTREEQEARDRLNAMLN